MHDQRIVGGPPLGGKYRLHRFRISGIGAKAVYGLRREGYRSTGSQHVSRLLQSRPEPGIVLLRDFSGLRFFKGHRSGNIPKLCLPSLCIYSILFILQFLILI
ncbi:hypothetical protein D3C71_1925080 [compost metagenome]